MKFNPSVAMLVLLGAIATHTVDGVRISKGIDISNIILPDEFPNVESQQRFGRFLPQKDKDPGEPGDDKSYLDKDIYRISKTKATISSASPSKSESDTYSTSSDSKKSRQSRERDDEEPQHISG